MAILAVLSRKPSLTRRNLGVSTEAASGDGTILPLCKGSNFKE